MREFEQRQRALRAVIGLKLAMARALAAGNMPRARLALAALMRRYSAKAL